MICAQKKYVQPWYGATEEPSAFFPLRVKVTLWLPCMVPLRGYAYVALSRFSGKTIGRLGLGLQDKVSRWAQDSGPWFVVYLFSTLAHRLRHHIFFFKKLIYITADWNIVKK